MTQSEAEAVIAFTVQMIPLVIVGGCAVWVMIGMPVEIAAACWRKFWRMSNHDR